MKNDVWLATQADMLDALNDVSRNSLLSAKVMMVDDDPLMTDVVSAHLEEAGYRNFIITNNPHEAMELVRREDPGVLLLDLMMPGLSGFEVLQALRADRELRYTPVIVLTAATNAEAKLRALQLGASDFLSKPVDASELVLRVRNTLAFHQYHRRASQFDPATDLPTLKLFDRGLSEVLARREEVGGVVGLFSVLAPECRQLSESVDHATADGLARVLAKRLITVSGTLMGSSQRSTPLDRAPRVARLSVERFALLAEGLRSSEAVEQLVRQLQAALAEPVQLGQHELVPAVCIGVAIAPADGDHAEALRQSADLAASHAQAQGRGQVGFATPELGARSLERLQLSAQLRMALRRNELVLHYQPKVSVRSNRIVGVEALVRWQHPQMGLVPPGKFIPLAEDMGLIEGIGQWVMEQACRDAAQWSQSGLGRVKVAVNVAKPQFDSGRLCSTVRQALLDSGLPARQLVLELTESMLMDDVGGAIGLMHDLKALGLTLSIDDFGTGYSSLAYLKRFPLDELKIDRSFIIDLPGELADLAIVRSVVELGRSLGMTVTAEGVETPAQLNCLRELACDTYQGYHFSRPVPADQLVTLLSASAESRRAALAAASVRTPPGHHQK